MTWNELQRARNDLKRPTTSKKWLETTYNEQETTWNDLEQPRARKKRHEATYWEQETTWNDLQQARVNLKQPALNSNLIEPLHLKNNQLEGSNVTKKQ